MPWNDCSNLGLQLICGITVLRVESNAAEHHTTLAGRCLYCKSVAQQMCCSHVGPEECPATYLSVNSSVYVISNCVHGTLILRIKWKYRIQMLYVHVHG